MAGYSLSRSARAKLADIYEYTFLNFGERRADTYLGRLHDVFEHLAGNPLMGRQFRAYRRHDSDQYAIFYLSAPDGIVIVEIFHHSDDIDDKID